MWCEKLFEWMMFGFESTGKIKHTTSFQKNSANCMNWRLKNCEILWFFSIWKYGEYLSECNCVDFDRIVLS